MNHDENCNHECDGKHPVTWPQVANNALEMIGIGFLIVLTDLAVLGRTWPEEVGMGRRSQRRAQAVCAPTGKLIFTERGAHIALLNAKMARALHHNMKRQESKMYRCSHGDHWHITKKG